MKKILSFLFLVGMSLQGADVANYPERYPLHHAAAEGNLEDVKRYIAHGLDIEDRDELNETPLHCAVSGGHRAVVQYLVEEKNANIEAQSDFNYTMLHFAAENGDMPLVEYLIEKGADIEAKTEMVEEMPLHLALIQGHKEIALLLLKIKTQSLADQKEIPFFQAYTEVLDDIYRDESKLGEGIVTLLKILVDNHAEVQTNILVFTTHEGELTPNMQKAFEIAAQLNEAQTRDFLYGKNKNEVPSLQELAFCAVAKGQHGQEQSR